MVAQPFDPAFAGDFDVLHRNHLIPDSNGAEPSDSGTVGRILAVRELVRHCPSSLGLIAARLCRLIGVPVEAGPGRACKLSEGPFQDSHAGLCLRSRGAEGVRAGEYERGDVSSTSGSKVRRTHVPLLVERVKSVSG